MTQTDWTVNREEVQCCACHSLIIIFLAVQAQTVDSSIRDSVTHSVTILILEHTETSWTLVTFETFDRSDEKTLYGQKNVKDKYKDKDNDNDKYI